MAAIIKAILVLLSTFSLSAAVPCKPSGLQCISSEEYQLCVDIGGDGFLVGSVMVCPLGTICDDSLVSPCVNATTTTPKPTTTTTTTVQPPTPDSCVEGTIIPGPACNQYRECILVMWWFDYKTYTCPAGQGFDLASKNCTSAVVC